jgi:hypothetical protein
MIWASGGSSNDRRRATLGRAFQTTQAAHSRISGTIGNFVSTETTGTTEKLVVTRAVAAHVLLS